MKATGTTPVKGPAGGKQAAGAVEHISLRVPWHDRGWDGTVCADPSANGTCVLLKNIGQRRRDGHEQQIAGVPISELAEGDAPPCVSERATFLSARPVPHTREHPFAEKSPAFRSFQPTPIPLPPYSAHAIPFRWMSRLGAKEIATDRELGLRSELEETVDAHTGWKDAGWVMHGDNQQTLLNEFFRTVRPHASLVFFYAKHTPLSDDPRRVLIGAAEITRLTPAGRYRTDGHEQFPAQLWETTIEHSLRPQMLSGILLPYQALLAAYDERGVDISDAIAYAPESGWTAFSYVTEHVSHDLAIDALLSIVAAGRAGERIVGSTPQAAFEWVDAQLNRLWTLRGPCPGFGSALSAFGITAGTTLAYALAAHTPDGGNPWPLLDAAIADPDGFGSDISHYLTPSIRAKWRGLRPERRELLELLSRFALTADQARRFYVAEERLPGLTDDVLLNNPYLVFEADRGRTDAVAVTVIDRGCFPDPSIAVGHPLPQRSAMADAQDARRVRALLVDTLDAAAADGHTLLAQADAVLAVRDRPLAVSCPVDAELLDVHQLSADKLGVGGPLVAAALADGRPALQLATLAAAGTLIREQVERRLAARPLPDNPDFAAALDAVLDPLPHDLSDRAVETRARAEKVAALQTLFASRVCVLVGSAGTGKTTLLRVLRHTPAVDAGGVLLVAPTGKARVQLTDKVRAQAATLAQFLVASDRYDTKTGRYLVTGDAQSRVKSFKTVIVDEASMLTEEQLAALLDAVTGVSRLILVGDPRQLPPIGAGRPFVDIVRRLAPDDIDTSWPKVGPGYAELTVPRRQAGTDRDDLTLANWFADGPLPASADRVWDQLRVGEPMPTIHAMPFKRENLSTLLIEVLRAELPELQDVDATGLANAFACSYGGKVSAKGNTYFPSGAGGAAERWQVLSPVRGRAWGTTEINRILKDTFRARALEQASGPRRYNAPPIGPERIVVGDKIINVTNTWFPDRRVYPRTGGRTFIANGEIGVVVGQTRSQKIKWVPNTTEVEFSGRVGVKFDYYDWSDDTRAPILELAWAVTIHKAQGSEFGLTVVIIPERGAGLTREMLYTALTRQQTRIVLLHEAPLDELAKLGSAVFSDTARRLTNLFVAPQPVVVGETVLDAGLVHRTDRGELVRSKNEVLIANMLHRLGVDYVYEQPFVGADGRVVRPDFTITTDLGELVLWEHLGMLGDPAYAAKWQRKREWYERSGLALVTDAGGSTGTLVVTDDTEGVDCPAWELLARKALGL